MFADASPTAAGRDYAVLAAVYRELGESARALELYELAVETLPAADRYLSNVLTEMAEVYEAEGRSDRALATLKQALALKTMTGATTGY